MDPIIPGMFVLDVTARNGVPFRALAIARGTEGPNPYRAPTDHKHAIVEFYDRRYPIDGEHGQFTGGYYHVDTVLGRDEYARGGDRGGLDLNGSVKAWTVDAESMYVVRAWLTLLADGGHLSPVE